MPKTEIKVVVGRDIESYIPNIARLRIEVFREYPYLYDGDEEYERKYMQTYSESERSVIVMALDGGKVVGASTGIPLSEADDEFREPIRNAPDLGEDEVFYLGESVLQESYRGKGIGHRFFDARESHAASLAYPVTAFCTVKRPENHPMKPAEYRPLDTFWEKRGYSRRPDLVAYYAWTDVGDNHETAKPMIFWIRRM